MGNTARTTNLTVQFWNEQRDILERAAQAKGQSISVWIRRRIVALACDELGIPMPSFPEFGRRGSESGVYRAASMLGVSVKEFQQNAARQVAEALLDAATAPESGKTMPPPAMVEGRRYKP